MIGRGGVESGCYAFFYSSIGVTLEKSHFDCLLVWADLGWEGRIARVSSSRVTLGPILKHQRNDHQGSEQHKENEEHKEAAPVGEPGQPVLLENEDGVGVALDGELRDHHSREAIAHGGEVHEPGDVALRRLLEYVWQVDHVAAQEIQGHVNDRCESHSCRLMVEHWRETVSHGRCSLDHHHENEVELEELTHRVGKANGKVDHKVEEEGHCEHDGNLGDQLGRRIDPHIVHATVPFANVHRLFALEHDHGRLEIQEHLQDGHEIDSSSHVLASNLPLVEPCGPHGRVVRKIIQLPKDGNH